jgi:hypothetical protein
MNVAQDLFGINEDATFKFKRRSNGCNPSIYAGVATATE